jgi:hypothetical protein
MGVMTVFKKVSTMMTLNRIKEIANFLIESHQPKTYDYAKKYPIKKERLVINKPKQESNIKLCSKCKSDNIEVVYGKYGYYFKCHSCNGNTTIKLSCSDSKCKPKIKKSKLNFYHICETCGKNEFFFKNKEKVSS